MKQIKYLICGLALLCASCGSTSIGGTYTFGDINTGPAGSLKIKPIDEHTAMFILDVNKGAPSYNMAQLAGQMVLNGNVGTYNQKVDANGLMCELTFKFNKTTVEVQSNPQHDHCGFGGNVQVAHVYDLTDRQIPTYYLNAEGDTILFERIKID